MIQYYKLNQQGIQPTDQIKAAQWIRLQEPTEEEIDYIIQKYDLPNDIFIATDFPEEVSRYEMIHSKQYQRLSELVLFNLHSDSSLPMEEQLQPISFIMADDIVISCANQGEENIDNFLNQYQTAVTSVETFIIYNILYIYNRFARELDTMKQIIDHLDRNARTTTKNEELFLLVDTEREVVYLDHTLADQALALRNLWNDEFFIERVNNPAIVYDVKLLQRHVDKKIHIYRDLLTSIGGLFSDMMSNRLNNLMKYLDSMGLIISVPTLISGIWGMNNRVPGQDTTQGFFAVMVFSALATLIFAIYIRNKKY